MLSLSFEVLLVQIRFPSIASEIAAVVAGDVANSVRWLAIGLFFLEHPSFF
jgi:uncharacterized membrane protein YwaF